MILVQLLGLSVNILCLVQKLPQLIRIYRTKTVDSISVWSVLLEQTAYTFFLTYNLWRGYPLSAFFEYLMLFIQNLLLLWALGQYSTPSTARSFDRSTPLYGILIYCLYLVASLLGLVPDAWMRVCPMIAIPLSASSKIIQLRTILTNRSAGQVSRIGWTIGSYSNMARLVTTLLHTKDTNMVLGLLISFVLNTSIVTACTVYPNESRSKSTANGKEKTT